MSNGKKYWGSINLNAIKEAIESGIKPFEGKKGKYLPVDIWVNEEEDNFGFHASISCYNKDTKQATYLGNLKLSDFKPSGNAAQSTAVGQESADSPDLPF